MTATNHAPGLDFEEWLNLRNRIIRLRKLGRVAMRSGRYRHAWAYFQTVRREQKRMRQLERDAVNP